MYAIFHRFLYCEHLSSGCIFIFIIIYFFVKLYCVVTVDFINDPSPETSFAQIAPE